MTLDEQKAFIDAYAQNIAHLSRNEVADFIALYESGKDFDYSCEHTVIMDALGIWHAAIKWQLKQLQGVTA